MDKVIAFLFALLLPLAAAAQTVTSFPFATVPLTGSEVFYVIQNNTNKQVNASNILASTAIVGANNTWTGTNIFNQGLTSKGNILDTLTATSAPSSVCSTASFSVAFSCDLTHQPIAAGLNITGTATLTEPTSGYAITPNLSSYLTYFTNASGWNNSTSSNSGRTGAWAFNSTAISLGQGDTGIYYCNGLINSAKVGATSFLAGPSVDCMAGQITAAQAHGYIELLGDLNCTDNGYDSACIGMVENFTRTVNTAAQGETWIGQRLQSKGADAIDAFASWTGPSVIGLDVTSATFTTNAAAAIPAGVGIFLNSVAGGGNNFPAQTSVGTSEIYYSSGLSAIVIQPQGNASLQVSSSGVAVSTTNGLRAASTASAAGTQIGYAAGAYVEGLTSSSTPASLSINPSGGALYLDGTALLWGVSAASSQTPATAGSGYSVGQTVTLNDSCTINGVFYVASISGGGNTGPITGYSIANPGSCSTPPTNPVSVSSTSGSGTGATFTLKYAPLSSANSSSATGVISPNVSNPSSGNLVGPGCVTAHQVMYADQNVCSAADSWQMVSTDPSAIAVLTIGGTCTSGDVITLTFYYGSVTATASYTVTATGSGSVCTSAITNGLVAAIEANSTLFNNATVSGAFGTIYQGGYGQNTWQIGYTTPGTATINFDWNSAYPAGSGVFPMQMKYAVTGSATETVKFPAGWFGGPIYQGGTTTGSANAQAVTATGFTGVLGSGVTFTAGYTNTGAVTLNVNSLGAINLRAYVNGSLSNLPAGAIVSGSAYAATLDIATGYYVLGAIAVWAPGGSTRGTVYQLPNSLDNNPAFVTGRVIPSAAAAPAPASVIEALYATGSTSTSPGSRTVNYGNLSYWLNNAQGGGAQSGAWLIQTNTGPGVYFGNGVYDNSGCAGPFDPITAGCMIDEGTGTFNALVGYWLDGTQNGQGASLLLSGGTVVLSGGTGALPISLTTGGNINLNAGSALGTSATTGFVNLPYQAGTPTGAPTGNTNCAIDTTNGYLNCYYGGGWHKIAFSSGAG